MVNIVIFGPPGAGKGTQARKIAGAYGITHIATGDIFRREIGSDSPLGRRIKAIVESGRLVPDELTVEVLRRAVERAGNTRGLLFDGFPRTLAQAKALDRLLDDLGETVDVVIALEVPEEELIRRLMGRARQEGRADDSEAVIRKRFEEYRRKTAPVLDYYEVQGKLHPINGVGTVEEVFDRIRQVLAPVISET